MDKKGFAMVINLIILVVLAILASSLLLRGVVGNVRTESYMNQTRAFWIADAGVSKAVYELNNGGSWSGWTISGDDASLQGSLGSAGDYDITVRDYSGNTVVIESTGYYPNRTDANALVRKVEMMASKDSTSLFEYAAFAEGALSMSGQAYTDSYDSSLGVYGGSNVGSEGDVGTNTAFSGSGKAYVDGDVNIPVGETVPDSKYYSGSVVEEDKDSLTEVTVPATLLSLSNGGSISNTTTLTPGDYQYWMINLSSKKTVTLVGPINLYLTGTTAISISGQAKIYIDPSSSGPVNIYFDGDISLSGQGITNGTSTPSNLILYGTGTSQEVTLSGQGDFYGGIYAPNSELVLSGQGGLYGGFVGDTVTISGQGGVHYDTQLGEDTSSGSSEFTIDSWRDLQNPYPVYQ